MAGFALTWRTFIAIKANKVRCTDRGIFSLFGPMCGLDVLVVLALLCAASCCCCVYCVNGLTSNRRHLRRVACMCICASSAGAIYVLTHPTRYTEVPTWKPPTLDSPYDEWRMSSATRSPPNGGGAAAAGAMNLTARLHDAVRQHGRRFHIARPYKHAVIDELLPMDIVDAVAAELPDESQSGCPHWATKCYLQKGSEYQKKELAPEAFGPATRALFRELRSARFVRFLEDLSGVSGLFPDPAYQGSGVHITSDGGYLNVHADFNARHLQPVMHRRVNMFIYLTPGWQEEYGGHLELWNRRMDKCEQRILPSYGRFVVFRSDSFSYHGHPLPMRLPPNVMRRSIAFYYYTKTRPRRECLDAKCKLHSTLFQVSRCGECAAPACRNASGVSAGARRAPVGVPRES